MERDLNHLPHREATDLVKGIAATLLYMADREVRRYMAYTKRTNPRLHAEVRDQLRQMREAQGMEPDEHD